MKKMVTIAAFVILVFTGAAQTTIGLQLYSFRNEFAKDVPGTLQKISAMGIRQIEGSGTYGMKEEDFKQLLVKNKLTLISFGADYKELESNPQAVAAKAKAAGAKYVMCAWIPHNGNSFTTDDADKAIAVFNAAGKILKASGISFCYHAHGYEFRPFKNQTLFDYMAERLNAAYVNFEMDVFWVKHPGQEPVALLKKYPNRFPLMHLKDRKTGTAGNQDGEADVETNVVLGTGDVGIAAIMQVARKYGVKYFFIEDESSRSMEQVPQSLRYLKRFK
jgi:sugar phosphate isomerase/epimerase